MNRRIVVAGLGLLLAAVEGRGGVFITEFSRGGAAGEFIEITNTGPAPVDLTGWSFDDASATPGAFSISALGTLAVGESGIISENAAATFRTAWGLSAAVKVVSPNDQNLGNGDGLNIFNASNQLVDTLTYPGSNAVIDGETWTTSPGFYGANSFANWSRSANGDAFGSFQSTSGYYGSPGTAAVPEPMSMAAFGLGGLLTLRRRRS
jgi:hypothetical protein